MQANNQNGGNAQSGGLNFVFESGSAGRENKKYVRSHAAKVGWSQRSRNKEARRASIQKNETTSRKRQKTDHESSTSQVSTQEAFCSTSGPFSALDGSQPDLPRQYSQSTTQVSAQPYIQYQHLQASSPSQLATSATSSYLPTPQLSRSTSQPQLVRQVATISPMEAAAHRNVARYDHAFLACPPQQGSNMAIGASHPATLAASVSAHKPHVLQMERDHVYTRHAVAFPPSSSTSPPTCNLPARRQPSNPYPLTAAPLTWRQYENVDNNTLAAKQSRDNDISVHQEETRITTQSEPNVSDAKTNSKEKTAGGMDHGLVTPPPTPRSSPRFLEVVLNPEVTLWPSVDSGSNSFQVFPVKWQPVYGRLLENYRTNMLAQLDEIMTGWSLHDKIEFNQMPLRLAMGEQALFYAILATASIMMPPGLISPRIPQWLQSRTVEHVNNALSDPSRATSDAIALTINMIAMFETIVGKGCTSATKHQAALRKLVDVRGGLKALSSSGTRDAVNLVRFLAWTDRVIWSQTGNKLMFAELEEDASVSGTNWEDIWSRMQQRVDENKSAPVVEELQDDADG